MLSSLRVARPPVAFRLGRTYTIFDRDALRAFAHSLTPTFYLLGPFLTSLSCSIPRLLFAVVVPPL